MVKSKSSWKWNYFTLESISKVKCSLCGSVRKPALKTSKPLLDHLKDKMTDDAHRAPSENASNMFMKREFSWDSHYETVFSDNMFKPYVKCKYCPDFIPMSSDNTSFITTPRDLGEHLEKDHNITYRNWEALENWIYGRTEGCDSPGILKDQLIKVDRCEVCNDEIGAKNAIMYVKHLIEKHRNDPELNIPWDIIPKRIRPSDVTVREDSTSSSDIADHQGSSGVFTESTQSSSKRKKEVLEMSELYFDYDSNDSFHDINTGDSQEENIMEIETSISSNQSMANVLKDGSQIDMQVPSTQPPDPRDIPSTSSGKRKGTQIPPNKCSEFIQLKMIELKGTLEYFETRAEKLKMLKANRSAVTLVKEPPYKRKKSSSNSTDDSD